MTGDRLARRRRLRVVPARRCSCSRERHPEAAATLLARAAEAEPDSRSILEALARAQYDAGRYEEAIVSFTAPDQRSTRPTTTPTSASAWPRAAPASCGSPPSTWRWPWRCAPTLRHYARALRGVRARAGGGARVSRPTATPRRRWPPAAPSRPARRYDVALLDLDGVVYVGPDAVPGVPEALDAARAAGMRLGFVTNNAARTPEEVAAHLTELGVPAGARRRHHQLPGRRDGRGRSASGRARGCCPSAVRASPPR